MCGNAVDIENAGSVHSDSGRFHVVSTWNTRDVFVGRDIKKTLNDPQFKSLKYTLDRVEIISLKLFN